MSHPQFHCISSLILRHAWLNLWNKHITTGRINQITIVRSCSHCLRNSWHRAKVHRSKRHAAPRETRPPTTILDAQSRGSFLYVEIVPIAIFSFPTADESFNQRLGIAEFGASWVNRLASVFNAEYESRMHTDRTGVARRQKVLTTISSRPTLPRIQHTWTRVQGQNKQIRGRSGLICAAFTFTGDWRSSRIINYAAHMTFGI